MHLLSHLLLCRCDKTQTKTNLGRKLFISASTLQSVIEGSQGMNSGWSHGGTLLTGCLQALLSLLSYSSQGHQPSGGTAYSKQGPPLSIINQESSPVQAHLVEMFS